MGAAKTQEKAAEKPVTEAWRLDQGTCALYTQDPAVRSLARKAGLRWMGEYYRPDGKGMVRLAAWQFAGPKEKVAQVLREAEELEKTGGGEKEAPAEKQAGDAGTVCGTCSSCGQALALQGRRQKYCRACAREAERRRKREWWAAKYGKVAGRSAWKEGGQKDHSPKWRKKDRC